MPDFPTGTVTFLFTDIEGSTALVRRLRERYQDVLAAHQRVIRQAVAEAGAVEIDTQGDSFFFVFRRARDAVLAAANAQRALEAHEWPEDGIVQVRMGIHTGEAAAAGGRYHGVAVHRAARISAAGHGGQVLLSQTTHNLLEDDEELPDVSLRDLGEQRLKDFERPVRVYQLVIPGLQERFPPLRTLDQQKPGLSRRPVTIPRWPVFAAVAIVAAGVVAALLLTTGGRGSASVEPHSVVVIDPKHDVVVRDIPLDSVPSALAAGEDGVWAVSTSAKTLTKIDPRDRKVAGSVAVPGVPSDVAVGEGAVWVLHSASTQPAPNSDARISRFRPSDVGLDATIPTGGVFDGATYADPIAVGDGVWVSTGGGPVAFARIARIDAAKGKETGHLSVRSGLSPILVAHRGGGLTADQAATWAVTGEGVIRLDPETMDRTPVSGPGASGPSATSLAFLVAMGQEAVWVAGEAFRPCNDVDLEKCKYLGGVLWRVDPGTNGVSDQKTRPALKPSALAVGHGSVWVADRASKSVWRIDPDTLEVLKKIPLGANPVDLVVASGSVWVAVAE